MKVRISIFGFLIILLLITGCASLNDAVTPSLKVERDSFDSTLRVYQPPVSSSGISEPMHTLGFEWSERTPDVVYVTVGAYGIVNISDVEFNVDGEIVQTAETASSNTDYGSTIDTADFSTRRFMLPIDDFVRVMSANTVKMKVVHIDTYSVSSFGSGVSGMRTINTKIQPFLDELAAQGALQ